MKLTLYDRIFKPQTVTLPNGHSVQRRRSRTPVIVLFLAVAIWLSLRMTGFDLHVVITKFRKMVDLLEKILQPDWSFFPKVVSPLIDTIKMSILIVRSYNTDFDGDALAVTIALDNKIADSWYPLSPHFNIFQLSRPRVVSGNVAIPKPNIATMARWIKARKNGNKLTA